MDPHSNIDFAPNVFTQVGALDLSAHNLETAAVSVVEISVVIPTYNAAPCLKSLYERLVAALLPLSTQFEIIFIEDCSKDNSWSIIQELASNQPYIRAYKLSRNFGQHAAITAGLSVSRGKMAVVMDCDLQDPPEDLPRLIEKAHQGNDVVMARRVGRQQSAFRKLTANFYFKLLAFFSLSKVDGDCGTFSVISRKVIDAYLQFNDCNRHYLMILQWLGFEPVFVDYVHGTRLAGNSSYTSLQLIKHAAQGLFFQTTILLQMIIGVGILLSAVGMVSALFVIWNFFVHSVASGWTSIIVLSLITSGMILFSLGIVGLYIGQIFDQVKHRPLFVLAKEAFSKSI